MKILGIQWKTVLLVVSLLIGTVRITGQTVDSFTDGDFTNNPTWTGDSDNFWVTTPHTNGDGGLAGTNDGNVLGSKPTTGSSALFVQTNRAYGQWSFSAADGRGWAVSSTNDFFIVLMSDTNNPAAFKGSLNFNGYYLRFDGGVSDNFILYRQQGTTKTALINTEFPAGDDGTISVPRSFKITRSNLGEWSVYIDNAWDITPTTLRGTATDNTITTGQYFGVVTNIGTLGIVRVLWFDNLYCGDIIYDTTPPIISAAMTTGPNTATITFSETVSNATALNTGNYVLQNIGNPVSAQFLVPENTTVRLQFSQNFPLSQPMQLQVSNVEDLAGNVMETSSITLLYAPPQPGDVVINEIFFDPSPTVGLPDFDFLELYNRRNYPVSITNWKLTIGTKLITLPTYTMAANSYLLLAPSAAYEIYSQYGTVLTLISTTDLTNTGREITLRDTANQLIHTVTYDVSFYQDPNKVDGGWSIEQIDPNGWCQQRANWRASVATIGGTPGSVNSVLASNIDVTAPQVMSVNVVTPSRIEILFNEQILAQQAQNVQNYVITPTITIQSATLNTQKNGVVLVLSQSLVLETEYSLTISNISDFCQNSMPIPHVATLIIRAIEPGDVVINEIFFDPSPTVGLPDYDFLELYNRRNYPVSITNWKLTIGTKLITLPTYTMAANSYLLLAPSAAYEIYSQYGTVLTLISTTDLTNTGREITLRDTANQLIHTVTYDVSFYQDPNKVDGGWSIEQIDPNGWCQQRANWRASVATIGGTPGSVNSVLASNIDVTAPQVMSVNVVTPSRIDILFNEQIHAQQAQNVLNYSITPSLTILSATMNTQMNGVVLALGQNLVLETEYSLTISNISDFCQNSMPTPHVATLIIRAIEPGDVVINEIFFDPSPTVGLPDYDFLELYNRRNYPVSITNWKLTIGTKLITLPTYTMAANSYLLLAPSAAYEIYSQYGTVLTLISTTDLTNTGREITLRDTANQLIHNVTYDVSFYQDPNKVDGGWSIEQIDPNGWCQQRANWRASVATIGGTPGSVNSVLASNIDVTAPQVMSVNVVTPSRIEILFNEQIHAQQAQNVLNYSITPSLTILSATMNTQMNGVVLALGQNLVLETEYSLTISNISDFCQNSMPTPHVATLIIRAIEPGDVVINEIFFDPSPTVGLPDYDFLELYNRRNYPVSITNWKLTIGTKLITLPTYTMAANSYLILAPSAAYEIYSQYGTVLTLISTTDLTNTGREITLRDTANQLIHTVTYDVSFYQDLNKVDGGWSIEQIDPNGWCQQRANWRASVATIGGTPGRVNSVLADNIDITPPSVQAVWAENVRRIKVVFNEVVSRTSVTNISNYQIDGGLTIGFIEYDSVAKNGITLILNNSISEGVEYVLTISNISDFCGNTLLSAQKTVVYSQPQFGTVVFNEIMCNPIENAGLPNIQYIELFNCSQYPISLFQWKLKSGSTVYTFPAVIIEPQSYLLIKSAGITDTIQTIVPEINLFSSTFLSRTSKNMELYSRNERLIHWISYSNTWYRDEYKKLGGFSLEQIDPTNFCSGGANWIASNAQTGGTPGAINSVNGSFPDNTAPEILYLTVDNDTCVTLHFNEPLRYAELLDNTKWSVEPAGMPANVIASVPTGNLISLVFNTPLLENTTYTVTLPTIFDCVGNEKQIEPKTFQLPDYPIENEIVINEILSNPFSGGTEFVELYNKTNRIFALNDLHVTRIGTSGNLDPLKKVSEFGHLLYPNDYLVLAKTRRQIAQFYPRVDSLKVVEVTSLPSIPNSAGSLLFMNTDGVVIDQFVYNEKMHTPLLRNVKGVSLERINPNGITQNVNNWQSAAETEGYATPTYKNSQYNENPASTSKFSLSSAIFSPDSDGYHDYLLIGYLFDQSGYSVNIKIFDSHGRLMKDLVQNHLAGIEGELKWDGTDRNNNRVQVGPYVIFIEYFDTSGNVNREKLVVTVAFRK